MLREPAPESFSLMNYPYYNETISRLWYCRKIANWELIIKYSSPKIFVAKLNTLRLIGAVSCYIYAVLKIFELYFLCLYGLFKRHFKQCEAFLVMALLLFILLRLINIVLFCWQGLHSPERMRSSDLFIIQLT